MILIVIEIEIYDVFRVVGREMLLGDECSEISCWYGLLTGRYEVVMYFPSDFYPLNRCFKFSLHYIGKLSKFLELIVEADI